MEQTPLAWSFTLGRLFATRIKVSIWLAIWLIGLLFQFGMQLGLTLGLILFVSILAHELIGHILAARLTGGQGDEVLMWPFGGLAFVQPAPNFTSRFFTAAAGPAVNLSICLMTLPTPLMTGKLQDCLHPFVLPIADIGPNIVVSVMLLVFCVNWILLLINLLPVYPLDGGKMLEAILLINTDGRTTRSTLINIGFVVGLLAILVGIFLEQVTVVGIGAFVLFMNAFELMQLKTGESYDDSFMGYDFSQGYTSLEKSTQAESKPGMLKQWKQKREEKKKERERQKAEDAERRLDELLQKVHEQGMDALTDAEKRELQKVSSQVRKLD